MIDPFDKPPPGPMKLHQGEAVILCEGFDECAVLNRLLQSNTTGLRIGMLQDRQNVAGELRSLADQVRINRLAALGLVFDAEDDRAARQAQIMNWLDAAGFAPPKRCLTLRKSMVDGVPVRTAYLINPHGKRGGMIESYFLPQIYRTKQWQCIKGLLDCYSANAESDVRVEKLIVRTFIAHRNGYNTGLNAAFNDHILDWTVPELDPFRRFLSLMQGTVSNGPLAEVPSSHA